VNSQQTKVAKHGGPNGNKIFETAVNGCHELFPLTQKKRSCYGSLV
jgi:hypothetical protein